MTKSTFLWYYEIRKGKGDNRNEKAYSNHMGIKACCDVKERLLKKNADETTVFCLHHFSHNGKLNHEDLVNEAKKIGFEVTYDTVEFEI